MIEDVCAIFLDWGGTLVHIDRQEPTRAKSVRACLTYLHEAGVQVTDCADDDLMRQFCGGVAERRQHDDHSEFDTRQTLEAWGRENEIEFPNNFDWNNCINATWQPWIGCLDPIGNIAKTLSILRDRGFPLGLVSNCATPSPIARIELDRLGILGLLSFTLFSSELGLRKPHPQFYEVAINRLRVTASEVAINQTLFVGDSPKADIDGPAQFGMQTALVKTGNASGDPRDLSIQPTLICDSIHDLPAVLSQSCNHSINTEQPTTGA